MWVILGEGGCRLARVVFVDPSLFAESTWAQEIYLKLNFNGIAVNVGTNSLLLMNAIVVLDFNTCGLNTDVSSKPIDEDTDYTAQLLDDVHNNSSGVVCFSSRWSEWPPITNRYMFELRLAFTNATRQIEKRQRIYLCPHPKTHNLIFVFWIQILHKAFQDAEL